MMTGTNSLAAIDAQGVATAVTRLGALPDAPLSMPAQVLEHAGGWRGLLAQLIAGTASGQQQRRL